MEIALFRIQKIIVLIITAANIFLQKGLHAPQEKIHIFTQLITILEPPQTHF